MRRVPLALVMFSAACGVSDSDSGGAETTTTAGDASTDSTGETGDGDGDTAGDGDATGDGDGDGDTGGDGDVPDTAYCQPAADWDAARAQAEVDALSHLNALRTAGFDCGSGMLPAVGELTMAPVFRCATRVHAKDMADNDYFAFDDLMGAGPIDRLMMAGYTGTAYSGAIAAGQETGADAIDQMMQDPGICAGYMDGQYTVFGAGSAAGGSFGFYWEAALGTE